MQPFDWHRSPLARETPVGTDYRGTQNVRRFLRSQCGEDFVFDRHFLDEWTRRFPKAKVHR